MRRERWLWAVVLLACACGSARERDDRHESEARPTEATCPPDSALTYENFGEGFFRRYCTGCHSSMFVGLARRGAPKERNFERLALIRDHRAAIDAVAAAGPDGVRSVMPPRDPVPTAGERRQLGEWLACGAP